MCNFQNVRKNSPISKKSFGPHFSLGNPSRLVESRFAPMFHVLSWGIPYALLMTGSPVVFSNNFTDPGAVFFFRQNKMGKWCYFFFSSHLLVERKISRMDMNGWISSRINLMRFPENSGGNLAGQMLQMMMDWKVQVATGVPTVWQQLRTHIQSQGGAEHGKVAVCMPFVLEL